MPQSATHDDSAVQAQLEQILRSQAFVRAHRSQLFLRYIVQRSQTQPDEAIKEYMIALDVFGRDASYDPAVDATVRVEAGRLRTRLREYYSGEGRDDALIIDVPKGGYRAVVQRREPAAAEAAVAEGRAAVPPPSVGWVMSGKYGARLLLLSFLLGAILGLIAGWVI